MGYAGIDDRERQIDRELGIASCEIEEWDRAEQDYHRSEPTPYRALDLFLKQYSPLDQAYLVDYGSGLGRINLYFYAKLGMPGMGIEVDAGRCAKAEANRQRMLQRLKLKPERADIQFLSVKAEDYIPPVRANIFYFFHPFSDWIFRRVLQNIIDSIDQQDRLVDLILYYPSFNYFQSISASGYFEEQLFVDCPWNEDSRDGFWVFRHHPLSPAKL